MPFARHASAKAATLATTFCAVACPGEPESAKAPPSMITSFCMSWMTRAVRPGSSVTTSARVSSDIALLLSHVRLAPWADLRRDRVDRRGRRNEQGVPVWPAPRMVADVLRHLNCPEVLTLRADHPEAARPGDPDVAELVAFHPVRDALLDHAGADALEEHAPVLERSVGVHVVDLDEGSGRVVDVELRLARREAEAVRHLVLVLRDDELQLVLSPTRRDHEDALPAELTLALDPEAREAPVPGIGEVDRAVRADGHVVRAVEVLALPVKRESLSHAVAALPYERARDVLADEEIEVRVEHHAVALEGRIADFRHVAVERDLAADVRRHVGEVEHLLLRVPDRPFGEREPRRELLDTRALLDE